MARAKKSFLTLTIVLKTALNHIMILHDENHAYFVPFSKNKNLDKSAVKKLCRGLPLGWGQKSGFKKSSYGSLILTFGFVWASI
jgi:hypothetical protein